MKQAKRFIDVAFDANLEHLKKRALEVHKDKIRSIKDFVDQHPDHPFSLANQHVVSLPDQSSWDAVGVLSMTGLGWWALNLSVDLTSFSEAVIFSATGGPDWTISVFTSAVVGYFYIDPSHLRGECSFNMEAVSGVVGEVSIDLFKSDGTQIGSFLGPVLGVSLSKLTGTGKITYGKVSI